MNNGRWYRKKKKEEEYNRHKGATLDFSSLVNTDDAEANEGVYQYLPYPFGRKEAIFSWAAS